MHNTAVLTGIVGLFPKCLIVGSWFVALMGLTAAAAQSPIARGAPSQPAVVLTTVRALELADCLELAFRNNPRLAAQHASLAAAEDGLRALENRRTPGLLASELPIRRRQAAKGVIAAGAGLDQVKQEITYAVTRAYITVLYAREQERVASGVVERLTATRDAATHALDAGARDATAHDVSRASVYSRLAESRRVQATQGVKRAYAALKEAIGLDSEAHLDIRAASLPDSEARPSRDEIVALALTHRTELVRALIFAEVVCLEIEAQGTTIHRRMETFAAGSDLHAIPVPPKQQNGEYRPGGVLPEMPTLLAGSRSDRMKRAQSFHVRALAVVDATRNLLGLEGEDAYLKWEEAALQVRETREAAADGEQMARDLNRDYTSGLKVKVEEVVNAWVLASQAQAQFNEARYRQILALADLERVTGGAFCAGLIDLVAAWTPIDRMDSGRK